MNEQLSFLRPYLRGIPVIVAAMIVGYLVAQKYLSYTTPMYESTTKIKLADLKEGATGNNLFKDLDVFASSNKIALEIEILKSQVLIAKALENLDFSEELSRTGNVMTRELYSDKPFLHKLCIYDDAYLDREWNIEVLDTASYVLSGAGITEALTGTFGVPLQIENVAALLLTLNKDLLANKPDLAIQGNYQLIKYSNNRLIEKISSGLDVVAVDKDVAVLRIIFKSNVPEKAAIFTNTLAQTYINDYIEEKFKTAEVTSDFLNEQIEKTYRELSQAEMKIQGYRVDNDIINIRQETETDLRKIAQLKIQQTNVKMSLDAVTELNDYVRNGQDDFLKLAPNFEAFTDLLSTEMIKKIKALQAEKTDLLITYRQDHELIISIDKKIKHFTDYFVESINNTRKNLGTKYDKLSASIEEAEKVFVGLPERERVMAILDRDFQIQQQSYIFLNEKRIEAEIAKAAKHAFHRVIHKAPVPQQPVSPNRPIIIIVSTLLGLIVAIVFIFLVNITKARVNNLNSVEKNTAIPVLFTTPHLSSNTNAFTHFKDEVLKMDQLGILPAHTSVTFSAFGKNDGVRYHLQHLAEIFSLEQRNFIVLTTHESYDYGLPSNRLLRLTEEDLNNFTYTQLKNCHDALRAQYDLVMIDNFLLTKNSKSILLPGMADMNICVVDARKTRLKNISELNIIEAKNNLKNLHIVINNSLYTPSLFKEIWWLIRKVFTFKANR